MFFSVVHCPCAAFSSVNWLATLKYLVTSCRWKQTKKTNTSLMLLHNCLTTLGECAPALNSKQPSERTKIVSWCLFLFVSCCFFVVSSHVHVCVSVFCSVWDALTDNYISTWDGPESEGLNGNLSDQEVPVTPHFSVWFSSGKCANT